MTRIHHEGSGATQRFKDAIAPVRYLAFNPRRNRPPDTWSGGRSIRSVRGIFLRPVSGISMRPAADGETDKSPCRGTRWKCSSRNVRKNIAEEDAQGGGITPRGKPWFLLKIILRGIRATTHNRLDGAYPSPRTGTVQGGTSPGGSTLNNDSFVATELPLRTRLPLLSKPAPSLPPAQPPSPPPPPSSSSLSPPYRSHHHQRIMRRWPEGATTSKRRREVAARSLFQQRARNTPTLGCYPSHKIVEATVCKTRTTYTINAVHALPQQPLKNRERVKLARRASADAVFYPA